MNYVFFHPFADSRDFLSDETINGCMDFKTYIEQKAKRTDGKAKTYLNRAHNPETGGVLAEFGSNLRLYVCGHGDKDESQLVGQTSHNQELAHAVGSSGIYYDSGKFRSSTDVITYRYVLLPGALIDVLKWEKLNQEIEEICLWACRSLKSKFATVFASFCKDDFPRATIKAYEGDISFGIGLNAGRKLGEPKQVTAA